MYATSLTLGLACTPSPELEFCKDRAAGQHQQPDYRKFMCRQNDKAAAEELPAAVSTCSNVATHPDCQKSKCIQHQRGTEHPGLERPSGPSKKGGKGGGLVISGEDSR